MGVNIKGNKEKEGYAAAVSCNHVLELALVLLSSYGLRAQDAGMRSKLSSH